MDKVIDIQKHNHEVLLLVDNKLMQAHRMAAMAGNTVYWQHVIERLYEWRINLTSWDKLCVNK